MARKKNQNPKVYSIYVKCYNCEYTGSVDMEFGIPAPPDGITCPNCGCDTCQPYKNRIYPSLPFFENWPRQKKTWREGWPDFTPRKWNMEPLPKYQFDVSCDEEVSKLWDNNGRGPEFGPA